MEPKEINREIKSALDTFLLEDDPAKYLQPVATEEDLFSRGLLQQDGLATPKGELFVELQDRGIFDGTGRLTERGYAYSLTEDELTDENNWRHFKQRAEDGIDDIDVPLGETISQVGGYVGDAVVGMGKRLVQEAQGTFYNSLNWKSFFGQADNRPDWLKAQMDATGAGVIEGGIEALAQIGTFADVGQGKASELIAKVTGEDAIAEENLWKAKQRQFKTYRDLEAMEAGEIAESVLGMAGTVEQMASAKDTLGETEFDQLYKQSRAGGNLFLDPTNVLAAGVAVKAATKAPLVTRLQLSADRILARRMATNARLAALGTQSAAAQRVAATAGTAAQVARKMADDLAVRAEQTGDQVLLQRSRQAADIAARTGGQAAKAADEIARIAAETEQLTAASAKLAARLPETAAAALTRSIQLGRQVKGMPAAAVGATLEKVGRGITRLDNGLRDVGSRYGVGAAYDLLRSGVGQAGLYGSSLAFGPVPAIVGAVGTTLRSGSRIEQLGKFARIIGKEMTKARGQVPFWQRVGNYAELSPVHRATSKFMSHVEMGGALPGAIRRTGRGVVAAYPVDLAFEYLAQGGEMNPNTLKQAFAESLVIGGSAAALGGVFMGSKARHRQLAIGDEINFRAEMTDPIQRVLFDAVPSSTRRALATYAAIHPNLAFRFTNQGSSFYSGGVVNLNVASTNPLRALAAHEVMHHVVLRNQMEEGISALLIGDGEAGGMLRSNDGTLTRDFQEFVDSYNARRKDSNLPPASLGEISVEYYIEQSADRVADMAESGELGQVAGRTDLRRAIDRVIEATLPRLPIIRSLHFNLGGLMDQEGRMVMGNGLLADGIRELPQVKAMTRRMLRAGSGRAIGGFDPMGGDRTDDRGGVVLPVAKGDKVILDKLISIFATEEVNGQTRVKYDKNGDPIMLDPATDAARSKIGFAIAEIMNELGRERKPGELYMTEAGTWEGTHIPADVVRGLEQRGILNKEQMRILKNINSATKNFTGDRFVVINHPATKKVGKKVRYATLAPTLRDIVPVGISVTKDGNLIVSLMSVTQLESNIQTRGASKRGKRLYNGDTEAIRSDVAAVMELHRQNQKTDTYFREKYGAERGDEHKNFINTVFGLVGGEAQRAKNPMFAEDNLGSKAGVYRTYRLDRISQATRMTGDTTPMPFVYGAVKINLMPNGIPTLDAQGQPVAGRMMSEPLTPQHDAAYLDAANRGDMDTAQRMVDDAARNAGNVVVAAHSTNAGSFTVFKTAQLAAHFGTEQAAADRAAQLEEFSKNVVGRAHAPARVMKLALRIENPLQMPDLAGLYQNSRGEFVPFDELEARSNEFESDEPFAASWESETDFSEWLYQNDIIDTDQFWDVQYDKDAAVELLKEKGYDGIVYTNVVEDSGSDSYIAFDPSQIKSADPVTYDDKGNIIPLSKRFNPESPDIRYMPEPLDGRGRDGGMQITPEMDAAYLDAVGRGDMDAAQAMVDQSAVTLIERVIGNQSDFDEYGLRSTEKKFRVGTKIKSNSRVWDDGDRTSEELPGVSAIVLDEMMIGHDGGPQGFGESWRRIKTYFEGNIYILGSNDASGGADPGEIVLSQPTVLAKLSAKPIERDSSGNIIPLSKRFNPESPDIRYMPEPLDVPAGASGAAVRTQLKHSKQARSFTASNATVLSPGERYLPEPVYHGTPHKVDRFRLDKIGTGEGAQAYGWGLYFAEDHGVARSYRNNFQQDMPDGPIRALVTIEMHRSDAEAKEIFHQLYPDGDYDSVKKEAGKYAGNLYTVKIKPDADAFLDWDKPLSEQSEKVRAALRGKYKPVGGVIASRDVSLSQARENLFLKQSGLSIYSNLSQSMGQREVSEFLASAGIRGIRYLDGNSRGTGEGSYNYVIFDENDIEITHENDKPVTP